MPLARARCSAAIFSIKFTFSGFELIFGCHIDTLPCIHGPHNPEKNNFDYSSIVQYFKDSRLINVNADQIDLSIN